MTVIRIEINDTAFRATLQRIHARLSNPRPLMAGIANLMLEAVEDNFEQERNPETGAKWPSLSQSTQDARQKKGSWPGKILQVSGSLASSVSQSYGDDFAAVGTNKVYAPIHQFGGKAGRKHAATIPARPFLGLSQQARQDIIEAVEGYVTQSFNP